MAEGTQSSAPVQAVAGTASTFFRELYFLVMNLEKDAHPDQKKEIFQQMAQVH